MKKLSHLTRISLLLAVFFAFDKVLAVVRQMIIARQFGASAELDTFNAANNWPDMLYALISGGALAMAFIPVLSSVLSEDGRETAWMLFSRVANLAFLVTGALAILTALVADRLVGWELGIAPGFSTAQQQVVVNLLRLNLLQLLIFSISGLVMAGLQANQHFFLPALAPLLYNLGQIFGALVLAPSEPYTFGPITLPAFNMGIYGLVYGVIFGALLHLLIQVPGLIKYRFRWQPGIGLRDPQVRQVLVLMGPRVLTMLFVQLIFIGRDNLGSRLGEGAVTALTYGWMVMQVPETLIGTAIGTAFLPTLSIQAARQAMDTFRQTVERAVQVLIAITLPVAVILALGVQPLIRVAFGFDEQGTQMVTWVAQAYLVGLVGHSLLEVAARSFYAQQNARIPLFASAINALAFIVLALLLYRPMGAAGIALANSLAYTGEAVLLLVLLDRRLPGAFKFRGTVLRAAVGAVIGGALLLLITGGLRLPFGAVITSLAGLVLGFAASLPLIWKELRQLLKL